MMQIASLVRPKLKALRDPRPGVVLIDVPKGKSDIDGWVNITPENRRVVANISHAAMNSKPSSIRRDSYVGASKLGFTGSSTPCHPVARRNRRSRCRYLRGWSLPGTSGTASSLISSSAGISAWPQPTKTVATPPKSDCLKARLPDQPREILCHAIPPTGAYTMPPCKTLASTSNLERPICNDLSTHLTIKVTATSSSSTKVSMAKV